jgi:hypothetical protein
VTPQPAPPPGAGRVLQAALRAGAEGALPEEAAVQLLIAAASGVWRHPDWQAGCVLLDHVEQHGTGLVVAEVDWPATLAWVAAAPSRGVDVPATQAAVVQVAAAIATGPLGAALGGLDPGDLDPVLTAIAHAVTGPAY